ncbi:ABC transporter permease [Phytoactinopolyspora halotolerans]|uniref:ABC transporter permease n=1 Tax=Phytoactinopolyspora halotolerans TaxID=1981512 RepID=A0A6L9S384_9ACTN|nr:ABC transporter permease [Phytoactinopolyspora halotolerans]
MTQFIVRRVLYMIPTLIAISIVTFLIIQAPPGDYLTTVVAKLEAEGAYVDRSQLDALRERYGLDDPLWSQYWTWISGIVTEGDFGRSLVYDAPVADVIQDRMGFTILLSLSTLAFVWAVAIPIGMYSAVKRYSIGDYAATFVGFLGLAIPNFLFALVLLYVSHRYFGQSVGGLFSPEYEDARWNLGKLLDLLAHVWIPVIIIGTAGTAGMIRIVRANLLDELNRPYVTTARAKGLPERRLLVRYPSRIAASPIVSTIGWLLPSLISAEIIVSVVLSLPTTGPVMLKALESQDMYLAGGFLLILSVLTVIGTLISDILLARLDPRIRYGKR